MRNRHHLTVRVPTSVHASILEIMRRRGWTLAETLRAAISLGTTQLLATLVPFDPPHRLSPK